MPSPYGGIFTTALSGIGTKDAVTSSYGSSSCSYVDRVKIANRGTVSEHLAHMRLRALAASTIRQRQYVLARVQAKVPVALQLADRRDLIEWQKARTEEITPQAIRAEITHVRSFYRWLQREQIRGDDPSLILEMPRAPRRAPRPMPEEDVRDAVRGATPEMRAILCLAAMAGLRACEIARLDWSEVDMGRRPTLTVVAGKGGHMRVIPIPRELCDVLRQLPDKVGPVIKRADGSRAHCQPHAISHRANRYLKKIGTIGSLHSLRHRCASVGFEATQDAFATRDYLGHASMQTTSGYTRSATKSIQAFAVAVGKIA